MGGVVNRHGHVRGYLFLPAWMLSADMGLTQAFSFRNKTTESTLDLDNTETWYNLPILYHIKNSYPEELSFKMTFEISGSYSEFTSSIMISWESAEPLPGSLSNNCLGLGDLSRWEWGVAVED